MQLLELINTENINLDLDAENKEEALEALAQMLDANSRLLDREAFIRDVHAREQIEATDLGIGVAIPHAKSGAVKQTSVAVGRLRKPIKWNLPEDPEEQEPPVRVIFLLAVREEDRGNAHLELISKIATLLIEDSFVEMLFHVKSAEELLEQIKNQIGES